MDVWAATEDSECPVSQSAYGQSSPQSTAVESPGQYPTGLDSTNFHPGGMDQTLMGISLGFFADLCCCSSDSKVPRASTTQCCLSVGFIHDKCDGLKENGLQREKHYYEA